VNTVTDTPERHNSADWIQSELAEAHGTIRSLMRQIKKEQDRHAEISRAYTKTVANLVEAMRENTALTRECELLRAQISNTGPNEVRIAGPLDMDLTPAEVGAIRKAMARLHHPDAGGDIERMKTWNAALDKLEHVETVPQTSRSKTR
jgi:predicted secreted Zn-dependent protease